MSVVQNIAKMVSMAAISLLMISAMPAFACRELVQFPDHLSRDALSHYSKYYVVKITEVNDEWYKGILQEEFSPDQKTGALVNVTFLQGEESHAICPLILRKDMTYLLYSDTSLPSLRVSRFNGFNIEQAHAKFRVYVEDLKGASKR